MRFEGVRKWVGFFVILGVLYMGAHFLDATPYKIYAEYSFYAFLVFVGGNAIEKIKDIIVAFRKK